jgi:hypothetical protein
MRSPLIAAALGLLLLTDVAHAQTLKKQQKKNT